MKLLDLGLARFYAEGGSVASSASAGEEMTGTGQAMGTADYMAPEQASDSRTVDIRADIYSLGCTLYKLLSGRAPFSGHRYANALEKMNAHVHQPVPPVRDYAPGVPEELAAILDRMLAKDPADRFATPAEVAAAMEPLCQGANLADLMVQATSGPLSLGERVRVRAEDVEADGSPLSDGERASDGPLSLRERVRVRGADVQSGSHPSRQPASALPPRRSIVRRILIGLGFVAFTAAVFAAGVVLTIKKHDGSYQLEVPKDSRTVIDKEGNAVVTIPDGPAPATGPQSGDGAGKPEAANLPRFRTTTVTRGDIAATIFALGTLEPQEVVDVCAQVTGQIIELGPDPRGKSDPSYKNKTVDYGTPVEKDTVLARIDPILYQAMVDQNQAVLKGAMAGLRQMNANMVLRRPTSSGTTRIGMPSRRPIMTPPSRPAKWPRPTSATPRRTSSTPRLC